MNESLHEVLAREIEQQADELMAELDKLFAKMAELPHLQRRALAPQAYELIARMEELIPKYQQAVSAIEEFEGDRESKSSN